MNFSSEQILNYIQRSYGKKCPLGVYLLDYFISQGLLKISTRYGKISGVIIFRKIKLKGYNDNDRLSHNPKGDCAFVVELCADTKRDIATLEKQMRDAVGKIKHIGMHRRGILHFYDYNKYINKLLGKDRL